MPFQQVFARWFDTGLKALITLTTHNLGSIVDAKGAILSLWRFLRSVLTVCLLYCRPLRCGTRVKSSLIFLEDCLLFLIKIISGIIK
jgi:hypothetical protein